MMVTAQELMEKYKDYSNPKCKISRLAKEGKYIRIIKGLYETDPETPGVYLSGLIRPSYVSFEYALYRHNIIPESVFTYTCATTDTGKKKMYNTPFGTYSYRDVPLAVFKLGLISRDNGEHSYLIAEPEKAVCDQLYSLSPVQNIKEMKYLVFEDQRMDYDSIMGLSTKEISFLAPRYRCRNVSLFEKMLKRMKHG